LSSDLSSQFCFYLFYYRIKSVRFFHSQVSKRLAVQFDFGQLETMNELTVTEAVRSNRVDASGGGSLRTVSIRPVMFCMLLASTGFS